MFNDLFDNRDLVGQRVRRTVLGTIGAVFGILIAFYAVEEWRRQEFRRRVDAKFAEERAETRRRNEIVNQTSHLRETCRSADKSSPIVIRGKALIWDFNSHPERVPGFHRSIATYPDGYTAMSPESLRAVASDPLITIFMVDPTPSKLGEFIAPNTDQRLGPEGYVYTANVCVVYWPEMMVAGATSLTGSWPDLLVRIPLIVITSSRAS